MLDGVRLLIASDIFAETTVTLQVAHYISINTIEVAQTHLVVDQGISWALREGFIY